jgi:protein-tyrosine phosphatase
MPGQAMYQKILIVCVGNICRSPTGERLLQKKLPGAKSPQQASGR